MSQRVLLLPPGMGLDSLGFITGGKTMTRFGLSLVFVTLFSSLAFADSIPDCLKKKGQVLDVNNAQVLDWKAHTKNEYHDRGHVKGQLLQVYSDATNHHHWQVQIGPNDTDTVEVIYNEDFGGVPEVSPGSEIEACGDYITANKQSGFYPPSPDGALVHWVHMTTNANHLGGFLVVDGTLCGQDDSRSK